MPKVTIDGTLSDFEDGLTLIRAAEQIGIEVPHYCWHPGLTIAGNCRMCLVEVEKVPKLQIACNTRVAEGMVVHTRNERVKKAQEAVLEFLLLNHPIDCPICDQAGECKLQDYYMDFDRSPSRFPVEEKNRKRKVVDLGPRVVLDQERCILCLRCTRFLDEVSETSELGVFERGDRSFIDLAAGKRLDNRYSENVVDVCPVGALTSKDFRFRARVWYLDRTPSVCTSCATGCNIEIFHRQGQIFRFRPRHNPDVNDYWMCDEGRDGYKRVQAEGRLLRPEIRAGDSMREAGWNEAIDELARSLKAADPATIGAVVSAHATNEETFLIRKAFAALGAEAVVGHAWSPANASSDDFLVKADKNPNRRGLAAQGVPTDPEAVHEILERARSGGLQVLVLFGADLIGDLGREVVEGALEAVPFVAIFDVLRRETALYANLLLPIGAFSETDGTVTNFAGRVQRLTRAFPPSGEAREAWEVLVDLVRAIGGAAPWASAAEVFDELASDSPPFAGLSHVTVGRQGLPLAG